MNLRFTTTETHMTYHYIVSVNPERFSGNTYTVTWGCLSGYRYVWSTDNNGRFQSNDPSHIKYNDTCTTGFASFTERAQAAIIQISYCNYLAATATGSEHSPTLSPGKSGNTGLRKIIRTGTPLDIRTPFSGFFLNDRQCFRPSFIRTPAFFSYHFLISLLGFIGQLRVLCPCNGRSQHCSCTNYQECFLFHYSRIY